MEKSRQVEMATEVANRYNEMMREELPPSPEQFDPVDEDLLAAAIEGCSMELKRYRRIEADMPDLSHYDEIPPNVIENPMGPWKRIAEAG